MWSVFSFSVLSKVFIIPLLGAAWFPYSDEHLYIELAKNIYFHHNLVSHFILYFNQFSEFLFPLLLSPLYAFYSPENILTIFRIFGLVTMSCAVFPAYKLGLAVLQNKKQAILISILAILIPEMTLSFSVVQEVIYYPLFLFTIYLIYQKISGKRINSLYLGFVFFLLLTCKSAGATVLLAYILYSCFELFFIDKLKNYKAAIVHILLVVVVVIGLKELLSLLIRFANYGSFASVGDYWIGQAIGRFKAGFGTFLSGFPHGMLSYLFFTTMIFMVFPLILPLDNLGDYESKDRKFVIFLSLSLISVLAAVVVLVYMGEGLAANGAQRVHFRYLFPYFIPFLIMMLKLDFSKLRLKLVGIIGFAFIVVYYLFAQPKFWWGSIIDSKSLLLIEEIQSKITNGAMLIFIFAVLISLFLGYLIYSKKYGGSPRRILIWTIALVLLVNQAYAAYSTYQFYTAGTNGITRKLEYSSLSKLVDSQPGTPLLFESFDSQWLDVLYTAQSDKDLIAVSSTENPLKYRYDPSIETNFLITSKNFSSISQIQNAQLLETDLTLFNVYQLTDSDKGEIVFNYLLQNAYPDAWLKDNTVLVIAGVDYDDQVEVTLDLITNANANNIVATFTDSTENVSLIPVSSNTNTISILVNKNPGEKYYQLHMGSEGYFIPSELGLNTDSRQLTYMVTAITVK